MWLLFVTLTEIGKSILCSVNGKFTFILISLCNMLQRCFSSFFILYYVAFCFEIRSICNVFNENTTWSRQQMHAAVHVPHCPPPSPTLTSPTHYSTDHRPQAQSDTSSIEPKRVSHLCCHEPVHHSQCQFDQCAHSLALTSNYPERLQHEWGGPATDIQREVALSQRRPTAE